MAARCAHSKTRNLYRRGPGREWMKITERQCRVHGQSIAVTLPIQPGDEPCGRCGACVSGYDEMCPGGQAYGV